jgi:catechol 2,3-dioxygenase-like lactoylglutathione lyase family enzyme
VDPRINVITLAVSDLDRALAFYRDGLGLESAGVIATEFVRDDTNPAGDIALPRRGRLARRPPIHAPRQDGSCFRAAREAEGQYGRVRGATRPNPVGSSLLSLWR